MKNSLTYRIITGMICILFTVLFMFPLILMLTKSFAEKGIQNYVQVIEIVDFKPNFMTSIIVVFGTLLVVSIVASMAAFAFSKLNFKGRNQIYYILLMGMMIPTSALVFPLFQIVKSLGINNTPFALVLPYATLNAVFNLMVLKNFFDGLPNELIEAAYIDGASMWKIFKKIMFPLSIPGLVIVLIQTFLMAWNELQMGMIFINDPAKQPLSVVPLRFMQSASSTYPVEVMYAALVICLAPIAIFYIFAQKFLLAGMTAGAVKG